MILHISTFEVTSESDWVRVFLSHVVFAKLLSIAMDRREYSCHNVRTLSKRRPWANGVDCGIVCPIYATDKPKDCVVRPKLIGLTQLYASPALGRVCWPAEISQSICRSERCVESDIRVFLPASLMSDRRRFMLILICIECFSKYW